ncbi:hypothetical protein FXO38_09688 [Capsicum annuum]|nr:hypothetical protein FXO38_09688 [Capsicum annuum]
MPCRTQLSALVKVSTEKTKLAPQALLRGVAQVSNTVVVLMLVILVMQLFLALVMAVPGITLRGSGLESQGGDSCTSTSANQQLLDLNLALPFQEKLSDPRITSMLKQKETYIDRELDNLLQDKEIYPKFAVMLKENGLDPMILSLLQRSSLDADREHHDSNPPVTDSNDVEDV